MRRVASYAVPLACVVVASLGLPACKRDKKPAVDISDVQSAAMELGKRLKGELKQAMEGGGVPEAINVCASRAQALTEEVARETGVRVGRASLKTRNPKNVPPGWVSDWLSAHKDTRKARGVEGLSDPKRGRILIPLTVAPLCVTCHGPEESLAPEVKQVLADRYPDDRATGYEVGDLRGALWAEAPAPER